jgi:hypothetical protein
MKGEPVKQKEKRPPLSMAELDEALAACERAIRKIQERISRS